MVLVEYNEFKYPEIELVERKGLGHPDTICDGLGEAISRALCKEYLERYGMIFHHNVDKITLVAGESSPKFNGGEVIKPIYILLAGRATQRIEKEVFPAHEVAIKATKDYLNENFFNLNVEEHVDLDSRIGQGSSDLISVFRERKEKPLANDTSIGVGYAPLTALERLVLSTEKMLTGRDYRKKKKFLGEDVKVMGFRKGEEYSLVVAAAFVGKNLSGIEEYIEAKEKLKEEVEAFAANLVGKEVKVAVNTADDYDKGSVYLTVTGLSAEMGDDGAIGRGNRCNGLITPMRPMSLEAVAGKNPVNHVGKIYNIIAKLAAEQIAKETNEKVNVFLLSGIGKPINKPLAAKVEISSNDEKVKNQAKEVLEYWLENIEKATEMFLRAEVETY